MFFLSKIPESKLSLQVTTTSSNELIGCGFESQSSHLIFRYRVFFEQGGP